MNTSNNCKDCGKELKVNDNGEIEGGKQLKYVEGEEAYFYFKCDECFTKNPQLDNFKKCEVYSRCCGYYRPVQNFNKGVKQQYEERLEFKQDNI